jgi:RecA/RadA recombinase
MKTLNTTYAELHKLVQENPDIKYHVKTSTGELTQINATVCKHSDTYDIEFSNGVVLTAGDKHCFMDNDGLPVATVALLPGQVVQTLSGDVTCVGRSNFKVNQEVYDISIDAPHWYTNDDTHGIIHHNTSFALLMAGAYLKKHKDACLMFYDSEFGSPQQYFESFGIDTNRVLHIPIKNIEELKFDIVNQLEQMERKDKVIIVIDSVGNLASKKELEDAMNEKSVADMTRAKALKGLFRMVTPYLTMKNISLLAINHTYLEIGLFPKSIVSGGCFGKGTLISMSDGTTKPIEEILVGDTVQTLDGSREVSHTWDKDSLLIGEPDCYEVTFEDGLTVQCSDSHPFLVNGGWIEARDLREGIDCSTL